MDLLELLHLRWDFSAVKTFSDVWQVSYAAPTEVITVCKACGVCRPAPCEPECKQERPADPFIMASISEQVAQVVEGEDLYEFDPHNFRRDGGICDIYDGISYRSSQSIVRDGLQLNPSDMILNMIMSADGVQLKAKSTQKQTWLIFGVVVELPKHRRYLSSKIMTFGIWNGIGKPPMKTMLEKAQAQMDEVNVDGMIVSTKKGPMKAFLNICGVTSDKRGKEMLLDQASSNGPSGCSLCTIIGEQVEKGRGTCRSYAPSTTANDPPVRRTHRSIVEDSVEAAEALSQGEKGFTKNGMKGHPPVGELRFFDMSHMFIDQMHCCDCGIIKKMMTLWFKMKGKPFSLNDEQRKAVERLLRQCKVPDCFSRIVTSLKLENMKSSGFKYFALHLSLACLTGILPTPYLEHWKLFVDAYATLNKDTIFMIDIKTASAQLGQFCDQFENLYGKENHGINFHYARHLPDMVDSWGPLNGYDMYPFEAKNGWVAARVHASGSILQPVMIQLLGSAVARHQSDQITHPEELRLLRKLRGERLNIPVQESNWKAFSKPGPLPSGWVATASFCCHNCSVKAFTNVEVMGVSVWSLRYRRATVRSCSYIACYPVRGGRYFLEVSELLYCRTHSKLFIYGRRLIGTWNVATLFTVVPKEHICLDVSFLIGIKPCIYFPFQERKMISIVTEYMTSTSMAQQRSKRLAPTTGNSVEPTGSAVVYYFGEQSAEVSLLSDIRKTNPLDDEVLRVGNICEVKWPPGDSYYRGVLVHIDSARTVKELGGYLSVQGNLEDLCASGKRFADNVGIDFYAEKELSKRTKKAAETRGAEKKATGKKPSKQPSLRKSEPESLEPGVAENSLLQNAVPLSSTRTVEQRSGDHSFQPQLNENSAPRDCNSQLVVVGNGDSRLTETRPCGGNLPSPSAVASKGNQQNSPPPYDARLQSGRAPFSAGHQTDTQWPHGKRDRHPNTQVVQYGCRVQHSPPAQCSGQQYHSQPGPSSETQRNFLTPYSAENQYSSYYSSSYQHQAPNNFYPPTQALCEHSSRFNAMANEIQELKTVVEQVPRLTEQIEELRKLIRLHPVESIPSSSNSAEEPNAEQKRQVLNAMLGQTYWKKAIRAAFDIVFTHDEKMNSVATESGAKRAGKPELRTEGKIMIERQMEQWLLKRNRPDEVINKTTMEDVFGSCISDHKKKFYQEQEKQNKTL
ncbi:hypothetical protein BV898_04156 [Hypsibius exemplaris]|uniref:Uncharacterized protein n=1 Tax=Hypsibius exemplaris TaxID=2072580 RepID=A0A1W0X3Q3_HYPEX|nr:hypothetical protein BV898_04156 [Hypsibius exemplaris]